jgi:serine phosphatase RsbU (regulator of sigma subunit)
MDTPISLKSFLFLFLLLLADNSCFSQLQVKIDSLEKIVNSKTGTEKFNLLIKLAELNREGGTEEKSLNYSHQALSIAIELKNITAQAVSYNELGNIFQNKLEWDKALKNYLKTYELYGSISGKIGISSVENNIGNVYREMRNYDKAVEYLTASINVSKEVGDGGQIASSEEGLGGIYYDKNDFEKALQYFQLALNYYKSVNNKINCASLENNIGSIYNELKIYYKAIENYKNAMDVYSQLGDSSDFSMCLANIGNVYNESGDTKKGLECTLKSLGIAKRIKDKNVIAGAYLFIVEGLQKAGDYKKAVEYQSELLTLKDTIYNLQTNQNIAEMQTKFDTEKKEKENEILKQQNDLQNLSINRQKIINYSVSVGLILMFALAFYIFRGYKEKQKANLQLKEKNILIEEKNKIVEEKNKDITDSIRYAKRLQSAILKPENSITSYYEDGFIFFKPKDIVSGDFYWFEKFGNLLLVAAADCTGHGVPGAFMSIIGCNLLSQAVNEYAITKPSAILNSLNKGLSKVLQQKQDGHSDSVKDGMDIALCVFNSEKMTLEYAGAYNPMWIVREGKMLEFKADKFPVGAFVDNHIRIFKDHEISMQKGDYVYLFSDGYADQFGGPEGKKFKYKQLQKLFTDNYSKPASEQKLILERTFESWAGDLEQVDDVLVIGIKI